VEIRAILGDGLGRGLLEGDMRRFLFRLAIGVTLAPALCAAQDVS